MIVSGVSGNATFDQQKRFPFMFNGHSLKLDYTKTFYELKLQQTSGGTISGSPVSGESGTKFNLSATPLTNHWHLDSYGVSGATMTGSSGTYTSADVSAKPSWHEDPKYNLTIQQSTGGTLAGSPTSGYSGDKFTLTATPNNKYSLASYSVTGTTMTGNSGMYKTSNVTAKANWQYNPETVVLDTITPFSSNYMPKIMLATASNAFLGLRHSVKTNHALDGGDSFGFGPSTTGLTKYIPGLETRISAFQRSPDNSGYRVYAFPTLYGGVTGEYISAVSGGNYSGEFVNLAYKCYSGDWKKYFGNNQSQFSSYSHGTPITYEYFNKVPNGINFGNSGFISAFTGYALFRIDKQFSYGYRVIHDGVSGNWVTGRNTLSTSSVFWVPLTTNCLSSNTPWIIDISASYPYSITALGNFKAMDWTWQQGQAVREFYYPCWSGKLCYKF